MPTILRDVVLPQAEFPHWLPIQMLQIADFVLVGFPFEITVQAGRYIQQAIQAQFAHAQYIAVSSVCNDYFGYCTTAEEYACQNYEGGHTLYGSQTNRFVAEQAAQLAQDLQQHGSFLEQPQQWHFCFDSGQYMPKPQIATGERYVLQQPIYIDAQGLDEGYWAFDWCDVNLSLITWHLPLVQVEYRDVGQAWTIFTTDEAYDVSVRHLKNSVQGMAHYQARWFNPEFKGRREYRLVIAAREQHAALMSASFGGNVLV